MNDFNAKLHAIYSFALERLKKNEANLCCASISYATNDYELADKALFIFREFYQPKVLFGFKLFWPIHDRQSRYSAMEHLMSLCEQNHFQPWNPPPSSANSSSPLPQQKKPFQKVTLLSSLTSSSVASFIPKSHSIPSPAPLVSSNPTSLSKTSLLTSPCFQLLNF